MSELTDKQRADWVRQVVKDTRRRFRGEKNQPFNNTVAICNLANVHWSINERAEWRRAFSKFEEGGKVAFVRSGMDCDSTQYFDVHFIDVPVNLVDWVKSEEERRYWLDGPERAWLEKPSAFPDGEEHRSADRALEAFEDGHPHSVRWGSL